MPCVGAAVEFGPNKDDEDDTALGTMLEGVLELAGCTVCPLESVAELEANRMTVEDVGTESV